MNRFGCRLLPVCFHLFMFFAIGLGVLPKAYAQSGESDQQPEAIAQQQANSEILPSKPQLPSKNPETTAGSASVSAQPPAKEKTFWETVFPILLLLAAVAFVLGRLPKVKEVSHSKAFLRRRVMNWLPLGLTYMLLYMGRYNLKVSHNAFDSIRVDGHPLMTNADFSTIFMIGTIVYGFAFLINGPLTDRVGGKKAILMGSGGAILMNALMAVATSLIVGNPHSLIGAHLVSVFSVLYAGNMYFQSFGAVAIVKCNASWFHVRERGVFGAIFGILIALGIYFAYDIGGIVKDHLPLPWVFAMPALGLGLLWIWNFVGVKDTPGQAGYEDFDLGDASSGDEGPQLGAITVFKMMLKNPVVVTIACVEFCSGFLRQSIMQWFQTFAKQTDAVLHLKDSFVDDNWGLLLCAAGILGGVIAGVISDHVFQSRRGPVAAMLYAFMLVMAVVLCLSYQTQAVGWIVAVMSLAVIGVHGMMSGTASMDFGGRKNVGIAIGIIDGFVYLGTAFMSGLYSIILPSSQADANGVVAAADPQNWHWWPLSMIPMALIGLCLAFRLWNAKPQPKTAK